MWQTNFGQNLPNWTNISWPTLSSLVFFQKCIAFYPVHFGEKYSRMNKLGDGIQNLVD